MKTTTASSIPAIELSAEAAPWCETFVPLKHYGEPTGDDICDLCQLPSKHHPVRSRDFAEGYDAAVLDRALKG